ncbi:YceI family protein [Pseudoalteromonas sp. SMS1]|uniref:YceI family protein n=1 Tax=Pseudoalteromonas sp. SMS1 TaxID=2908894 RepID=UPI001F45A14C|nr:YceI family protein [Pseudoalteromonas sp. SMS1]MCF2858909.1 YceI family protein [Pseudoalteromonas sp. SMS1]
MLKPLLIGTLCFTSQLVSAWQLDNNQSDLSFTSVKLNSIAENHHFKQLSGHISAAGQLQIELDLVSIESLIPIRNERMKKMLFNVEKFPMATITADLKPWLGQLKDGIQIVKALPVTLNLHGKSVVLNLDVVVNKAGKVLQVTPQRAVLINSRDFGLQDGIESLRKIAGLDSISHSVPVTFNLIFNDQ